MRFCPSPCAVAVVLVALAAIVAKVVVDAGEFRALPVASRAWHCSRVLRGGNTAATLAMPGLEDAVVFREWTLFSSDDRDLWMGDLMGENSRDLIASLRKNEQGAIFAARNSDAAAAPYIKQMSTASFPHADFHPHGMGLWERGRKSRLFVVNHQRNLYVRVRWKLACFFRHCLNVCLSLHYQ